jgi:hypothetical protein
MAHAVQAELEDEGVDVGGAVLGAAGARHAGERSELQRLLDGQAWEQEHVVVLSAKANHLLYVAQGCCCAVDGDGAAVRYQPPPQAM